jgi:hypothetical protein
MKWIEPPEKNSSQRSDHRSDLDRHVALCRNGPKMDIEPNDRVDCGPPLARLLANFLRVTFTIPDLLSHQDDPGGPRDPHTLELRQHARAHPRRILRTVTPRRVRASAVPPACPRYCPQR